MQHIDFYIIITKVSNKFCNVSKKLFATYEKIFGTHQKKKKLLATRSLLISFTDIILLSRPSMRVPSANTLN